MFCRSVTRNRNTFAVLCLSNYWPLLRNAFCYKSNCVTNSNEKKQYSLVCFFELDYLMSIIAKTLRISLEIHIIVKIFGCVCNFVSYFQQLCSRHLSFDTSEVIFRKFLFRRTQGNWQSYSCFIEKTKKLRRAYCRRHLTRQNGLSRT